MKTAAGRQHLVYAVLLCILALHMQAQELAECFSEFKLVYYLDYQQVDECATYISQVAEAQVLGDSNLCPAYSTTSSCVKKLEPQLAEEYKNCATTDDVPGEVCLSVEAADELFTQFITPVFDLGIVCAESLVQEIFLIELAAQKYYGCTEYVDEYIVGGPGPAKTTDEAAVVSFGPSSIYYVPQSDLYRLDEFEVCFEEALQRRDSLQRNIKECNFLDEVIYSYVDTECPTIEQVDACVNMYNEDFQVQLEGCATRDAVPGETCLTTEKISRLFTRILKSLNDKYLGFACLEAVIHYYVTFFSSIVEVAGCTDFVNGQLAGGPFTSKELLGIAPFPAFTPNSYLSSHSPDYSFFFAPNPSFKANTPFNDYNIVSFSPFNDYIIHLPVPNPVPIPVPVPVEVPIPVPVPVHGRRGY